jgi:hypothetical protein
VFALGIAACGAARDADDDASSEDAGETQGSSEDEGAQNQAPSTPVLLTPADGAVEVAARTALCWEPSTDPEGDEVAYRVFVDGFELSEGILGDGGFAGPCTGELDLLHDREYAWEVQAFEVADPTRASDRSDAWDFHTIWDGDGKTLFEDDFEEPSDWEVESDAGAGAWVHGSPEYTEHQVSQLVTEISQPGGCSLGEGCWFTGHNADGDPADEDVAGGSTRLTSPPFDLGGSDALVVSMARFFYKSETGETGSRLSIELVVPDPDDPEDEAVFVLEQLEAALDVEGQNAWTAVGLSACGVPAVDGARLRIVATDVGTGIVEAAVDSVRVTGYQDQAPCENGIGGLCDPDDPDTCAEGLICCGQGVLDTGVHRCAEAVASLDLDDPPADPDAPGNGPLGCDLPDLTVREEGMRTWFEDVFVEPDSCTLYEGCVDGSGWRTVLRFDAQTPNVGSRDLVMGIPANHPDLYSFSPCHQHYHFDGYARYALLDGKDVVATGHKQAYCLVDWRSWAWPWLGGLEVDGDDWSFNCYNQGISRGWEDVYEAEIDCQWVDVTDVTPGDYVLRIEVNPTPPFANTRLLVERDYGNNVLEIPIQVP